MSTTRRTFLSALAAIAATCVAKPVGSDAPEPFNPRCPEQSRYGRCVKRLRPEHTEHQNLGGERWCPAELDAEKRVRFYFGRSEITPTFPVKVSIDCDVLEEMSRTKYRSS